MPNPSTEQFSPLQKTLAWLVHLFTASGIIAGFLAILAIADHQWQMAMFWLLVSQIIDGIDGSFARWCRVKEVLPYFDGKMLDSVIDFATYAIIPAFFLYESSMIADEWRLLAASAVLLTSAIYYGKSGMVSPDFHFVGFPVMWNLVVFYFFFVFDLGHTLNLLSIAAFCLLHFVPLKYPYPSRTEKFMYLTLGTTVLGLVSFVMLVFLYPEVSNLTYILKFIAFVVLLYFAAMTLYKTFFVKK